MPPAVERFAHLRSGLVLVTGPTGSGKSTTLAAIINEINENYAKHIVTIEDPIEFVHQNKTRDVLAARGRHAHQDLRHRAARGDARGPGRDPGRRDARTRGRARDHAPPRWASLVFGTLHTNSAAKTIDRLIDVFPTDQQEQVRLSLAEALAGVVSQLLLPTADGKGRVAAHEILREDAARCPTSSARATRRSCSPLIQGGKQ